MPLQSKYRFGDFFANLREDEWDRVLGLAWIVQMKMFYVGICHMRQGFRVSINLVQMKIFMLAFLIWDRFLGLEWTLKMFILAFLYWGCCGISSSVDML
jgi:hypothetical protein